MHFNENSGKFTFKFKDFVENLVIPRLQEPTLKTMEDYLSQYEIGEDVDPKEFVESKSNFEIKDHNDIVELLYETLVNAKSYQEFLEMYFELCVYAIVYIEKAQGKVSRIQWIERITEYTREEEELFLKMCGFMDSIQNRHGKVEITATISSLLTIVLGSCVWKDE